MPRLVPAVVPNGQMRMSAQPVLHAAADVTLRPWEAADADDLMAAFSEPSIQLWHRREFATAEEAREWIKPWRARWGAETDAGWAITSSSTGDLLGQISLRDVSLEFGTAQISYWVLPPARRRGVASDSVLEVTRWAFEELGLHRLVIHHSTSNEPSCMVAERAGFVLEGTATSALLHLDGWHDMHTHGRVAPPR
ncbi:MAG: hypothetical protein QOE25_1251 [Actinomycetota bacterium]|jgi:RimJ/RimL family protein N-acetyltransferase|nr:hypothetical protein [Actinomycetota bacterium]